MRNNQSTYLKLVMILLAVALAFPAAASAVEVGEKLPLFKAEDMNGEIIDLSKIVGKKPVALVFWASWSSESKTKFPEVNELYEKWGYRGLKFIGINVGMGDTVEKARKVLEEYQVPYPNVFDKTGELSEKYRIKKVFCMIVAAKDGTVMMKYYDSVPVIDDNNFLVLKTYEKN